MPTLEVNIQMPWHFVGGESLLCSTSLWQSQEPCTADEPFSPDHHTCSNACQVSSESTPLWGYSPLRRRCNSVQRGFRVLAPRAWQLQRHLEASPCPGLGRLPVHITLMMQGTPIALHATDAACFPPEGGTSKVGGRERHERELHGGSCPSDMCGAGCRSVPVLLRGWIQGQARRTRSEGGSVRGGGRSGRVWLCVLREAPRCRPNVGICRLRIGLCHV